MEKLIDKTTLRYFMVGIINTIVGTGTMFLLYNLGCSYYLSTASNYLIGGIVSYFLNKYFTFQSKGTSYKQILRFVINTALCWYISYSIAKPLMRWFLSNQSITVQENISMVVGMGLYICLNYLGQRFFVFRKPKV